MAVGSLRSISFSPPVAADAEDVADALEPRQDPRQLLDARDLHDRVHDGGLVRLRVRGEADELDLVLADDRGDVAQETGPVPALDAHGHRVGPRAGPLPLHLDHALALPDVPHVRAVRAVDRDAAAARDVADDRVARHGVAADAEADQQVADPLDGHAAARRRRGRRRVPRDALLRVVHDPEARDDLRRRERAVAERREERGDVVHVQLLAHTREVLAGDLAERALGDAPQLLVQQLLAVRDVLLALLALEPLAE